MRKRLNGWQRLWVIVSALYVCTILVLAVRFGLPPGISIISHLISLAGFMVVPVIGLYIAGLALAWILDGFRSGDKSAVAWQRLWIIGSVALLICTAPVLFGSIHAAKVADRILSTGHEIGEEISYDVDSDENGRSEVFVSIWANNSSDWASLGPVVNPEEQAILERSGKFNPSIRRWTIPRNAAISLLKKYDSSDFMFRTMKALVIWLSPPVGIYLLAYFIVFGSKWVYEGFRTRKHKASA